MSRVYMLRTCGPGGLSHGNFRWPLEVGAKATAPDANRRPSCGGGLHGLVNGVGDWFLAKPHYDGFTIVFSCDEADVVRIGDEKAKAVGEITIEWVSTGFQWAAALEFIWSVTNTKPAAQTAGDYSHAQSAGRYGNAQAAGYSGHAQAAGRYGNAQSAGGSGHAQSAGESGHAQTAGYGGHAQAAGCGGHAQAAGRYGHAQAAGRYGNAHVSGLHGIACAIGLESRVRADCDESPMVLSYLDATHRPRIAVAYTGEGGIQKGKWYKVNDRGEFIPAENSKPGDDQ